MTPFTRNGQQILANGFHYADCVDEKAAAFTVAALNAAAASVNDSAPRLFDINGYPRRPGINGDLK